MKALVGVGVSTSAAYAVLEALDGGIVNAQDLSTLAEGEEDGAATSPWRPIRRGRPGITTKAIGEEDARPGRPGKPIRPQEPDLTTLAIGEEEAAPTSRLKPRRFAISEDRLDVLKGRRPKVGSKRFGKRK